LGEQASRITASADFFNISVAGRPFASINLITAHDAYLRDVSVIPKA